MRCTILATALSVLPAACFAQAAGNMAPRYVDAIDWPTKEAGLEKFALAEHMLSLSFDRFCGDAFCEGPYPNLRPMQLSCSVDTSNGTMKRCLWIFAGSDTSVDASSGAVRSSARVYTCNLRLAPNTPVEVFYETMYDGELLGKRLPMTRRTLYDSLVGCLP